MLSLSPLRGCQGRLDRYNVRFMFSADDDFARLEAQADDLVQNHRHLMESLIAMRKRHNLKQDEVAERMGVSQPAVSAFERYDSNPTLSTIRRYALAVHARIEDHVSDVCTPVTGTSATGWNISGAEAPQPTTSPRPPSKQPWELKRPRVAVNQ